MYFLVVSGHAGSRAIRKQAAGEMYIRERGRSIRAAGRNDTGGNGGGNMKWKPMEGTHSNTKPG